MEYHQNPSLIMIKRRKAVTDEVARVRDRQDKKLHLPETAFQTFLPNITRNYNVQFLQQASFFDNPIGNDKPTKALTERELLPKNI